MFDLDQSVAAWRSSLPADLRARPERIDELEQHLRDAFEQQAAAGAAPHAAWSAALDALGPTPAIAGEFVKLDGRRWLPAWLAGGGMALVVIGTSVFLGSSLRDRPLLAAHVLIIVTAYCAVFAVGFLATAAVLSRALFGWPDHRQRSLRIAGSRLALLALVTTVVGVVLGSIWARNHLGRWWGWDPKEIGGLCVLAWSAIQFKSFHSRSTPAQFLMLLGVIGNAVVATGWFGPVLLSSTHLYGTGPSVVGALLGVFLVLQIALVYLVLQPSRGLRVDRFGSRAQG
jgi:hypothetical protein